MCKLNYVFCVQSKELLERIQSVRKLKDSNIEKITCIDDVSRFLNSIPLVGMDCDNLLHIYDRTLRYKFTANFYWGLYHASNEEIGDFRELITDIFSFYDKSLLQTLIEFKITNTLSLGLFSIFKPQSVS